MDLIYAICDKDVACVRRLLDTSAGRESVNSLEDGLAPIHYAAKVGNLDILKALHAAGADLEARSDHEYGDFFDAAPLHFAAAAGSLVAIDFFLDSGASIEVMSTSLEEPESEDIVFDPVTGISAMLVAARAGRYEAALYLLRRGADISAVDSVGSNILHYCAECDRANGPGPANPDLLAVMRAALDGGVDLEARAQSNPFAAPPFTPLLLAASCNRAHLVNFLVAAGADVNARDENDCTPLLFAVSNCSLAMFETLLGAGADIHAVNEEGGVLQRYPGLNPPGDLLKIYEIALEAGLDINQRAGFNQKTPLLAAAGSRLVASVQFLVDRGADVNCLSLFQDRAAHIAATLRCPEIVKIVVDAGVDFRANRIYGTVTETAAYWHDHALSNGLTDTMLKHEATLSILVAAGERDWDLIPTPCRGLERALPAVMQEVPEEREVNLPQLFARLMPEIQGEIRAALLLLNRFCPGGGQDVQLLLLKAIVDQKRPYPTLV